MKKNKSRGLEEFLFRSGINYSGAMLRYYRKRKKLTQADVAKRLGKSQQIISRHENGVLPSAAYLMAYSYIYDVSIDKFFY